MSRDIADAKELLRDEKDREMKEMLHDELSRLQQEEIRIFEEANRISLPSNK